MIRLPMLAVLVTGIALYASGDEEPSPKTIRFFVYHHTSKGQIAGRRGAEVVRVGLTGTLDLGKTDERGEVTLKTKDLFVPGAQAVLFCDSGLKEVCAALRVDSDFLRDYAEFNVHLPVIEVIDRYEVGPMPRVRPSNNRMQRTAPMKLERGR